MHVFNRCTGSSSPCGKTPVMRALEFSEKKNTVKCYKLKCLTIDAHQASYSLDLYVKRFSCESTDRRTHKQTY